MFDSQRSNDAPTLMTIGYEGANILDFVHSLSSANVRYLIDVRELPLSRKKGFSKNSLKAAVESNGIKYLHLKQLGDPKPGRDAAKSGDMKSFRRIFNAHMKLEETQRTLHELVPLISEGGACLLCFERHHRDCHRHIVANALSELTNIELKHIGVLHGIAKE